MVIDRSYKIGPVHCAGIVALLLLCGCGGESTETSAADKALSELQAKYDELTQKDFDDTAKWAAEDIENIGDWEYQVHEVPYSSPDELESMLNTLGDDRWEVFWVERTETGFLVMAKKPAVSYLSKIPLSQLGKFIISEPDSSE